jgi:hypothetical protein
MSPRPLPPHELCTERLELIFPRTAFDAVLSSPQAGWAVASMLYVEAVVPADGDLPADARWVRPTMLLWLSDDAYARADEGSRAAWLAAAIGPEAKRTVANLMESWGLGFDPKYGDNSRETIRGHAFPRWLDEGVLRVKPGVKTTSPLPRWALTDAFADLFDPELSEEELGKRVETFRDNHMSPTGKVKALTARRRGDKVHAVSVTLPDGTVRQLEPGEASLILKGVIEAWAPARLKDPIVVTISEPGDKIYTADATMLQRLGISIELSALLPDALLVDIGQSPPDFWIIEAVASDGPIDEDRKAALLKWAAKQRIPSHACRFLTAFGSRNAAPARRRLKDLAVGTSAWYLDEPTRELSWDEISRDR